MENEGIKIVILAAGAGKRMDSDLPKVLMPLAGKPMIRHVLEPLIGVFKEKPIAIVGHKKELVQGELGDLCIYAVQKELLGTGHAVSCAKEECGEAEHIVVLSGDQPFIELGTIKDLIDKHIRSRAKITFTTTDLPDFFDWRKAFMAYGRIMRENDEVVGIREYKDASEEEKNIKEVNTGCYIFDAKWLWHNLGKIKNINSQKEYYLTDLFHIAFENREKIETLKIKPHEALGANTKEELETLEKFAR